MFLGIDTGRTFPPSPLLPVAAPDHLIISDSWTAGRRVVVAGTLNASPAVLTSTRGGAWTPRRLLSGLSTGLGAVDFVNGSWGYATTGAGQVLKTVDAGRSWRFA